MATRARFSHVFPGVKGLTEAEAQQLTEVLRTSSNAERQAARQRLVEGCAPLTVAHVKRHVRRVSADKHLIDDLISVGMLEAVRAVDRLARNGSTHALSTLANSIRHAIRKFPRGDSGLALSAQVRLRLHKRGVPVPKVKDVPAKKQPEPWAKVDHTFELLEEILLCCSGRDRQIVEMRLQDMSPREIAIALGMSPESKSYVCKRLRELWQRLEARNEK